MKRILVVLLMSIFIANLHANDIDSTSTGKSDWAINISYPTYFGIFLTDALSKDYRYYPFGISFSLDWKKKSDRIWLSPGVIYRTKKINHVSGTSETLTFLEFPIKVKYCFNKNVSAFDPFVTSALSICRFESKISGADQPGAIFSPHSIDYLPMLIVGFGSNIQLYKNIDMIIESNFGYGINKVLPNRAYIDLQVGVKFKI